jgi:hypothetical protein
MAVYYKPRFNNIYYSFLQRALNDGGDIVTPNASEIQGSIATMADKAALLGLIPTAYNTGILYSMLPQDGTGDFTVSRNGTATYFNQQGELVTAAADVPRLSFDPSTGEFQGVLIENAATNYVLSSEALNTSWQRSFIGMTWEDNAIDIPFAPGKKGVKGNRTSTTWSSAMRFNTTTLINGIPFFHRIYVKYIDIQYLKFLTDASQVVFTIDLLNKSLNFANYSSNTIQDSIQITEFEDDWIKIEWLQTFRSSQDFYMTLNSVSGSVFTNVSTTGSCYFWQAQGENTPYGTSDIFTTTSQVTRPADIISVTGSTSLFGQTQGTILFDFETTEVVSLTLSDLIFRSNGYSKVAFTYSSSEKKLYQNGLLMDSATGSFSYGTLDSLFLGSNLSGSDNFGSVFIKEYSTYDSVFSEQTCIQLTTL